VGRDHFAHKILAMGTKEKWTVKTGRNATQVCPHRSTPPSTVERVTQTSVSGNALRFMPIKMTY
jgi:hypothetical protein